MRVLKIVALFLTSALVAGCASTNLQNGSRAENAQATEYGNYLSARFAASQHNLKDAAEYYRASALANPANPQLLGLAFFFATSAGDIESAGRLAEKVVAITPDDRAGRLTMAVVALKRRDYSGARKLIGLSAKGPFSSLTVSLIDGWAAAATGDKIAAKADFAALRAQDGVNAMGMFHLALLSEFLGETDAADASYRIVLSGGAAPRVIDAYGRFLERNGRTQDASKLYAKYIAEPGLTQIVKAGLARLKAGTRPDPLVSRAEDGAAEALFGIASALTDQNSVDVSILYLRLALYLRPGLDLGAVLLADRLEGLQKYEDAIAVYRAIDKSSAYYRLARVEMALDEARMEKSDAAIADLKALTAVDPTNLEAWTALGDTYRSSSKFAEAAAAYDHAIALLSPVSAKDWPIYFARAVSEEGAKNWNAAEVDLKKALQLAPNEPSVLNYLGYSYVDQNRNIAEALAMLEKAQSLKPTDGYIADSVGWAYFKLGRFADAAKTLESAVELIPGDSTINDHLGDAYWRVGRRLEAKFQWTHALSFGPDEEQKTLIQKKLKDGLAPGEKPN